MKRRALILVAAIISVVSRAGENLFITEFMADNGGIVRDRDGDSSDWIEIYNAGVSAVNLAGWHLTDDPGDPAKWTFPATNLGPGAFLIVFASGKNRAIPGAELHTSFQLDSAGEYLALVRPDLSAAHAYAPVFPRQQSDLSYGVTLSVITNRFLVNTQAIKWLVPTNAAALGANWMATNYDDSTWANGWLGFGFDAGATFDSLIRTDVEGVMRNVSASAFLRVPFLFDAEETPPLSSLMLRAEYDDGFIAYLNGVEIARRNAPVSPAWNSTATSEHPDAAAIVFEDIDVSPAASLLRDGTNVLAIHVLNLSASDDDVLVTLELVGRSVSISAERYFVTPTPRQPNSATYLGVVADTKFSVDRGFYDAPFSVTLTSATPGVTIRCTLDGSDPTPVNGFTYSNAIPVTNTTTLRAAAFKAGYRPTDIDTHTYIFIEDVVHQTTATATNRGFPSTWPGTSADYAMDTRVIGPGDLYGGKYAATIRDDLKAIPSLSIVMNMSNLFSTNGIYVNSFQSGLAWERPTSMEVIFPDSANGKQVNCGIRIHGSSSRTPFFRKFSFRLLFKDVYGPAKWHYAIFGTYSNATDEFDDLVLRANGQEGWMGVSMLPATYLRDTFSRETLLAMGGAASHARWFHLYLNGLYWGMYELVERPDNKFSSAYFGGDKDNWDAVTTPGIRAAHGDLNAWYRMLDLCSSDLSVNAQYMLLQGKNADGTRNPALTQYLDVDSFIDYFILHFYSGTQDWPANNWWIGRERTNTSTGFKFYPWDADFSLLGVNENNTTVSNGVALPYSACRQNAEFRVQFGDHVQRHFFNDGALYVDPQSPAWDPSHPERNVPASRFARLCNSIQQAIVGESARWGDANFTLRTRDADWAVAKTNLLNSYFPQRNAIVLQQFRNAGLYPSIDAPRFNLHGGSVSNGFTLVITNPNDGGGTIFYTLEGSDPRRIGGSTNPAALTYITPVTLNRTTLVRARILTSTNWSALVEARFVPQQNLANLQLSEIMYNPPKLGSIDGDEFEFLELKNVGTNTLDLGGLTFTRGLTFTFSNGTSLGANQYLVLARNAAQFAARYTNAPLHGLYTGKLDNNGETLALSTALGDTLFSVTYNNAAPWPAEADNSGLSLQRMNFTLDVTNALSWIAAAPTPGTSLPAELLDSDADGLPDGWEQLYGFNPGANDASADADGDGLSNLQEFITGTNPLLASDTLRLKHISAARVGTNLHVLLGFDARSNKTYTVIYRDTVAGTASTQLVNVTSAPTNRFVIATDVLPMASAPRFYRLTSPRLP